MARKASRPVAVERVRVRWWMLVEREEGRADEVIWGVELGGMKWSDVVLWLRYMEQEDGARYLDR